MKTYYIYAHYTADTNECFYIGVGKDNRAWDSGLNNRNEYWHNIVNKHGYTIEIIKDNFTNRDEAVNKEVMLQLFFKPKACLKYGDKCQSVLSEKTLLKMSVSHKGKKLSQTTKNKLSLAGKGRKLTKEHKEKIGIASSNRIVSDETKLKIKNGNLGKKVTDSARLLISRSVINCRGQIFESILMASKLMSCNKQSISNNLTGKSASAGRYHDRVKIKWSYYEC